MEDTFLLRTFHLGKILKHLKDRDLTGVKRREIYERAILVLPSYMSFPNNLFVGYVFTGSEV